jgi:hypothetical protein
VLFARPKFVLSSFSITLIIFPSAFLNKRSIPTTRELPVLYVILAELQKLVIPSFKKLSVLKLKGFGTNAG